MWPGLVNAEAKGPCEKLPWPPTAEQRRQVGEEIKGVLERSTIPEAKELLHKLFSKGKNSNDKLSADSRVYYGEWRLAEDMCTLWTARIRNKLIRHQYEIQFTYQAGSYFGSGLGVITTHAQPK